MRDVCFDEWVKMHRNFLPGVKFSANKEPDVECTSQKGWNAYL